MSKKKKYIVIFIVMIVLILIGVGVFIMNSITPKNVFDEMYLSVSNSSMTKSRFNYMNGVNNFGKEMDINAYTATYTSNLEEDTSISIGVGLESETVQFFPSQEFSKLGYEILFCYTYYHNSNELEIIPVRISVDNGEDHFPTIIDAPEEVSAFLEEHAFSKEAVEEYRDYFLNKVMQDWVNGNGDKSDFSLDNYGDYTIIDRTFEGMGEGWE